MIRDTMPVVNWDTMPIDKEKLVTVLVMLSGHPLCTDVLIEELEAELYAQDLFNFSDGCLTPKAVAWLAANT
jgi:hypothetical protein